jgi:hypothetical protein
MIREWMESYEQEFEGPRPPPSSKLRILADTDVKIEPYRIMGMKFLKSFLRKSTKGGKT